MPGPAGWASEALQAAKPAVFWTDRSDLGPMRDPLRGTIDADLVVVGGGFTGLWAALEAVERSPGRRVVLLEAHSVAFGASGRNGGFVDSSLTHGLENAVSQWPDEVPALVRLGKDNLAGLVADVARLGIECDLTESGDTTVATEPWQVEELAESAALHEAHGITATLLDEVGVQARVRSPQFIAGMHRPDAMALVDPALLASGLATAGESAGVVLHERSAVTRIDEDGSTLVVHTDEGRVRSERVLVATNAYRGPIRRARRWIMPVYDHVFMTEPLGPDQLASLGWAGREGLEDAATRFHYFRLTADDRVLWGGFEPSYHWNNAVQPEFDQHDRVHTMLAEQFFTAFPQLDGVRISHRWGGPIATNSRFSATWGLGHDGRSVWVAGYAGLGVAASRFGAAAALDLVDGLDTERTSLEMVRKRPIPLPPEPFRAVGVSITKRAIEHSDEHGGRRGLWLRLLDRFNVGLDF